MKNMMNPRECRNDVGDSHSRPYYCTRLVTLLMTFLLLHSSIITPSVLSSSSSSSQSEEDSTTTTTGETESPKHMDGLFHFKCVQLNSSNSQQHNTRNGQPNMGAEGSNPEKFDDKYDNIIRELMEKKRKQREKDKMVINAALGEIDNISRGKGGSGTLCNTPSKMYKIFPGVRIGTDLFAVPKGKADLIAYFLQLSREKAKSSNLIPLDEQELNGTFQSLFEDAQMENIQFVEDIQRSGQQPQPQTHTLYLKESRKKKTIKYQKTTAQMNEFPWYFNPSEGFSNDSFPPIPLDTNKFNLDPQIINDPGHGSSSTVRGYWTWPYFQCGQKHQQSSSNKSLNGKWIISYSVPFQLNRASSSKLRAYGILSFNVDLSQFDINQCDFTDMGENQDMNSNPLHSFRETHKCDRATTTCEFAKQVGETGWLKGNYVCKCKEAHYAYVKRWNNSIPGYDLESTWCGTWTGNESGIEESADFSDIVTCRPCPEGCPDCNEKPTCMADMNSSLRLALLCVSALCTLAAVGFIVVVCKFRKIPVFKTSSPIFICIMLSGCIIMYSEMIALYPVLTVASCIAVKWTRHLGFCITYTALALKLCRVYLTFRVKSAHKIKLTEKHLLHWMSPIMVIMLLYLFAWTISDPPDLEVMKTVDNKRFFQCVYNWWDHALAIGEVIFLAYGVWICWKIRENPDAQFISYSIYNIALVNVAMVSLHLLIVPKAGPDMKYVLAFMRTQLSTTTTIGLVIGSKLIRVWRGEAHSLKEIANSANGFGQDTLDLGEENLQLKEELQKMATQIEKLKFYAMCKNNPHLKQSSVNITNAEMDFGRLDSFSAL